MTVGFKSLPAGRQALLWTRVQLSPDYYRDSLQRLSETEAFFYLEKLQDSNPCLPAGRRCSGHEFNSLPIIIGTRYPDSNRDFSEMEAFFIFIS
ncbi:hypothetical protein [Algoriphagus pacificus]|uniref:Uncharacterized protein n=1 Tax=Algoriphagus pacificus TaxID=2811234 RepID=A0ABS3CI89_9BACT|nr:hypothetical protein [Algoriphagus pacificus]MBN7816816.1 hypothetical protein [Algoriphagus pacificus]